MIGAKLKPRYLVILCLLITALLGWAIAMIPAGKGRPIEYLESAAQKQAEAAPADDQPLTQLGEVQEERVYLPPVPVKEDPLGHIQQRRAEELQGRFEQAVTMLHMRQYEYAIAALKRVLELAPNSAEAQTNLGYAYLGLGRDNDAIAAFQTAMHLRPEQANAYYGLAMAYENQDDLEGAMGAMKMFLDFSQDTAQDSKYVRRARSALWEWEAKLGEGPWGPTRGIPPGWTEEMVRRDGTGVGVYGMKRGENLEQAQQRREREAALEQAPPPTVGH